MHKLLYNIHVYSLYIPWKGNPVFHFFVALGSLSVVSMLPKIKCDNRNHASRYNIRGLELEHSAQFISLILTILPARFRTVHIFCCGEQTLVSLVNTSYYLVEKLEILLSLKLFCSLSFNYSHTKLAKKSWYKHVLLWPGTYDKWIHFKIKNNLRKNTICLWNTNVPRWQPFQ